MVQDVVRELGYLTLGSRLKRLGETLQAQAEKLLRDCGTPLPASHCPLLLALDRLGPLSVGELSRALGVSQPVVTRMLGTLESEGWVRSQPAATDRRIRRLQLSKAGTQLVSQANRVAWVKLEAAVADACRGLHGPLLSQLAALEEALAAAPLVARTTPAAARG